MVGDGVYLASGSGRGSFMPTLLGIGFVSGSWGEGLVVEEGRIGGKSVGESRSKGGGSCIGLQFKKGWGVMSGWRDSTVFNLSNARHRNLPARDHLVRDSHPTSTTPA